MRSIPPEPILALGLLMALLAACDGLRTEEATFREVEPAELEAALGGDAPVMLDVRTADEFARGHLPGAIHVPHTSLAERLPALALPADREIVVYCERGGRASHALRTLEDAGHTRLGHLKGDMAAWRADGRPTRP